MSPPPPGYAHAIFRLFFIKRIVSPHTSFSPSSHRDLRALARLLQLLDDAKNCLLRAPRDCSLVHWISRDSGHLRNCNHTIRRAEGIIRGSQFLQRAVCSLPSFEGNALLNYGRRNLQNCNEHAGTCAIPGDRFGSLSNVTPHKTGSIQNVMVAGLAPKSRSLLSVMSPQQPAVVRSRVESLLGAAGRAEGNVPS